MKPLSLALFLTVFQLLSIPGATRAQTTNAGEPAPNAKFIDADRIFSFNAGAAIIRKGSSSALIDGHGNFIAPYNTYDITTTFIVGPVGWIIRNNGIYAYNNVNANWGGYINSRGKIIYRTAVNVPYPSYTDNKQMIFVQNSLGGGKVSYTYITAEGASYTSGQMIEMIVDGIGIVRPTPASGQGIMYKKLTGETIAGPFDDADAFSDGMARVGKKDQFGELKYGFINMQGKLVIPFSFSIPPTPFSGGYARVQPKDRSEFEYAFIDKSGQVVFKQTQSDVIKNGRFDHFTNYGLAFSEKAVMDASFKMTPKAAFFQALGIPADSWFMEAGAYMIGESSPKIVYSTRTARNAYTRMPIYGFVNLATKKVIPPVFEYSSVDDLTFDPVSHLAKAKVCIGRNNVNVPQYREGYINEDGQFVLVKGEGSKW